MKSSQRLFIFIFLVIAFVAGLPKLLAHIFVSNSVTVMGFDITKNVETVISIIFGAILAKLATKVIL